MGGIAEQLTKAIGIAWPFEIGKRSLVRSYVARRLASATDGAPECVTVTRAGLRFELDLRVEIDLWIYLTGWWEKTDCLLALASLAPGDTVVDVGANMGFYSLHAARVVGARGRVFAFEPNPEPLARLRANAVLNGFDWIVPVESALGDRAGEVELFRPGLAREGDASLYSSYVREGEDPASAGDATRVSVLPFDEFRGQNKTGRVALMKIDVEGAEPAVLEGARTMLAEDRPRLMVEYNREALSSASWDPADYLALIRDLGYEIFRRRAWRGALAPVLQPADAGEICNLHCVPKG